MAVAESRGEPARFVGVADRISIPLSFLLQRCLPFPRGRCSIVRFIVLTQITGLLMHACLEYLGYVRDGPSAFSRDFRQSHPRSEEVKTKPSASQIKVGQLSLSLSLSLSLPLVSFFL